MVKDHSDSERGNPLPPHGLLFPINRQDNTYHGLCYTSHGALAGMRNSSMGPAIRYKFLSDQYLSESHFVYHKSISDAFITINKKYI